MPIDAATPNTKETTMTDYMLTVFTLNEGHHDIQVNGADDIHEAIAIAESVTGCRVSHGRGGVLGDFRPGRIIDAKTGAVAHIHDEKAGLSTQIVVSPHAAGMRDIARIANGRRVGVVPASPGL